MSAPSIPPVPGARQTPSEPEHRPARRSWRASDLRGAMRLAAQATVGISRVAEGVHQSVLGTLGLPGGEAPGQARGLTGLIYRSIRGVTGLVDAGLQAGLARLEPLWEADPADGGVSWERDAVIAALNGVMGDRLEADGNPLCTAMQWCQHGRPLDLRRARGGRLMVLVHGLCMNDLQWQRKGHDHGAFLAEALGYTPVYLRYNTGLHVSANGERLDAMLSDLVRDWPTPVTDVSVLAHSMGGLVARSACAQAGADSLWRPLLRHLVFLGTPHHGAPLERAGHVVDVLLGQSVYARPFARLARLRSAGITDLRFGHVQASDWEGRDRFHRSTDRRAPLPLPADVACHAVAGTLAAQRSPRAERLVGDGLVPLRSALGQHDAPERTLAFARRDQAVLHRLGHLALLSDPRVARQLLAWLQPAGAVSG